MMELHQIRYFLAVARTLNFTHAAEECHVAQPSLSRAIKTLEDELGGELFRRERALSHLTDLGRLMLPLLQQCYDSAVAAKSLASSYKKGETAPLRLALSQTINLSLLVPILSELVKIFPGLELQFFRGNANAIVEQLKSGGSELAIAGPLGADWDRLDAWPLFEEGYELVVGGSHPVARRNQIGFDEISGQKLFRRPYCEQAGEIEALLKSKGIEQRAGDQILSDQDLISVLQANAGGSIMPVTARGNSPLCSVEVEGLTLKRSVSLYAVAGRERSGAASGLMKLLRAADWSMLLPQVQGAAVH